MDFDKTHFNFQYSFKNKIFFPSLPDQLSRLCPTHFWIQYVWTFYSYWHFTIWTFSNSSNFYGHFITMDNLPYGFFTHRSWLVSAIKKVIRLEKYAKLLKFNSNQISFLYLQNHKSENGNTMYQSWKFHIQSYSKVACFLGTWLKHFRLENGFIIPFVSAQKSFLNGAKMYVLWHE